MTAGGVADVAPGPRPPDHDAPAAGDAAGGAGPEAGAAGAADAGPGHRSGERARRADRRWMLALLAICVVGLGIRVGYALGHDIDDGAGLGGDARYYHEAANLLADGKGFVHPYYWDEGIHQPGADHPPGYQVVLAVPSLLGFDSVRDHQVFSALLGTVTVALVGIAGLQVAGRRTGLVAAAITAVYPNIWMNDGAVMSETLALLCGALVVIAAYAAWQRPDARRFALVGVTVGLATLSRAEAAMLVPLVAWPLALWARGLKGWRPRVTQAVVASAVAVLVVAPWVVPNLFRFEEPTTLSTQLGPTIDVANCPDTYSGSGLGSWSFGCAVDTDREVKADPALRVADRSVIGNYHTDKAVHYIRDHTGRLPAVVAARFGRAWGLYVPRSQLDFDRFAENRPRNWSQVGLAMYYVLAVASVAGVIALRRRRVPSFPLVALIVNVAITVVLFYGSTRFRAPAEPSLAILAAVGFDALVRRVRHEPDPLGPVPPDARGTTDVEAGSAEAEAGDTGDAGSTDGAVGAVAGG